MVSTIYSALADDCLLSGGHDENNWVHYFSMLILALI